MSTRRVECQQNGRAIHKACLLNNNSQNNQPSVLQQRNDQKMHILHGGLYQLKLLMLFLKRGINKGYSFRLGTEVAEAKKFDDLVFEISTDGKKIYRLLQAKHRQNDYERISFDELLTESDGDFSLVKYYFAFQDCKKENFFKIGIIKDVTVCTNIDLDLSNTFKWKNEKEIMKELTLKEVVEKIYEKDEILDVNDKSFSENASRYRFKNNIIELLQEKLQSYNLTRVATKLIKCILEGDGIRHHQEPFQFYHVALAEEVIDKNNKRFHENFIMGEGLSEYAKKFREAFIKKIELLSKGRLTLEKINKAITSKQTIDAKEIGLKLSRRFGVRDNWPNILQSEDLSKVAIKLIKSILASDGIRHDQEPIKSYHVALAEEVIDKNNKRFHENFRKGKNLSECANKFREAFIKKIELLSKGRLTLEKINKAITSKQTIDAKEIGLKLSRRFGVRDNWPKNLKSDELSKVAIKLIESILESNEMHHHQEHIVSYHIALAEEVIDTNHSKFHEKFLKGKKLSKYAKKFRKIFIKKIELLSNRRLTLKNINGAITSNAIIDGNKIGLKLSKQFGVGYNKNWPKDAIALKDIEEFLDHLIFAVNQPNEKELGELIERDLGKEFNFIEKSYVYNEFFQRILKWSMGEGESFISSKTGSDMLANIKDNLKFIIINGELKLKIERSGIKFNQDAIDEIGFKQFLNSEGSEQKILHILAERNILTTIKVYQVLHDNNLNYIFLPLSSFLAYKDHITQSFLCQIDLLIIQCDDIKNKTNVEQLFEHIINIVQSDKNKAVVLIAEESIILDNLLTKKDERNALIHLTSESQNEILKKKVLFQGIEINLDDLIIEERLKQCIDGDMLSKFINGENIEIWKTFPSLNDIGEYYIDRVFNCQTKIKASFQEEKTIFLIIHKYQGSDILNLENTEDIVIISDTEDDFEELSCLYHDYNIHWLKQNGNEYMWQQSHGSLDRLRKFFHTQNKRYAQKKIYKYDDKLVIVDSPVELGKTTMLTKLAIETKKFDPTIRTLRMNLLDHSTTFLEWKKKKQLEDVKEVVKRLMRKTIGPNIAHFIGVKFNGNINFSGADGIKGLALLEIQLFISFYNQCKITALLDGFDEMLPIYQPKVVNLLKILKNSSKLEKFWITTRPYDIVYELENELGTISCISRQNQEELLEKLWKNTPYLAHFNVQNFNVFSTELSHKFSLSTNNEHELLAIPLHAYMIALVFQDLFKDFQNEKYEALSREDKKKLSEKLNLSALYEYFIQTKSKEMQNDITNKYNEFIDTHMLLAMYEIFEGCWLNKILSEEEKSRKCSLLEKIKNGEQKTGITIVIVDNKPRFIHPTFAEYFVARYFCEKLLSIKSENLILAFLRTLINDDRTQICKFLHAMVQQNKNSVLSHINYKMNISLVLDELIKNTYSRTEYDISKKVNDSTKLLWIIIELIFPTGDNDSNDNSEIKKKIKHLANTKKLGLLSISAEMGYIRLTNALAKELDPEIIRNDLKNDEWCNTPLWLAASNDNLNILEILMQKFSYDSSWIDRKSKNLFQAIFSETAFDVLSSCLNLNIININSPFQDGDIEQLPILCCIESNAPINLVELLIEKVDVNYLNNYKCFCEHDAVLHMAVGLFKYPKNITDFAIEKRINFNKVINRLLKEIDLLTWKHESLQANSKCTVLSGETYKLFAVIKFMLQCGIIYDCQETLQLAERICYTHKLLHQIYGTNNEEEKIVKVDVLNTILKLIMDCLTKYPNSNDFKIHIDADGMFLQYGEAVKINLLPNGLETLLFEYFKNTNTPILRNTLGNLHDYVYNAYKELFISQAGHTLNAILESTYQQCSSNCTKGLLKRVIELYVNSTKPCQIEEVVAEITTFSKVIDRLLKTKESNSEKKIFAIKEVLYILGIKNVNTSKNIQELTTKYNFIQSLLSVWSYLNNLTRTELPNFLERISTVSEQSLDVFNSLSKISMDI